MHLNMSEWPLIWMEPHDDNHPDDEHHQEEMRVVMDKLMGSTQRFVLLTDRLPTLEDLKEKSREEKQLRAQFFKTYRSQFSKLCAAMIIVGNFAQLPIVLQKAVEGIGKMIGIPVLFALDVEEARLIAGEQLARE